MEKRGNLVQQYMGYGSKLRSDEKLLLNSACNKIIGPALLNQSPASPIVHVAMN